MKFSIDVDAIRKLENRPEAETAERIREIRAGYGSELCLLAHLYQRKAISDLADFVGDSFGLSRSAAAFKGGKYIVFCGVRFMAESAAILCREDQWVIHPDPEAGCPMADMAPMHEVTKAWTTLASLSKTLVPVTYMNSTADLKAFCGERGGTICTSTNAVKTFEWASKEGEKIFFLPDEHLGRNTALKMGVSPDQIVVWNPSDPDGEEVEKYETAKVLLWRGYCPVHQKFTVRDVEFVRHFYPGALIVVHPECPVEVVERADAVGSTEFIRQFVANQTKAGDKIFIGTEVNLIQNLASQYRDRMIAKLHRSLCLTMYQITMGRLLYSLENLDTFEKVSVSPETRQYAKVALDRMLALR
ncbi:MAG: quinolinate synthase NadA [Deltaproteobacteria bacterium]|nr:quinolinate synthase NadA [Deltaproteobacteria bacterium]